MRMSSSRSVQSSGSESTRRWKVSARAIAGKPSAAILDAVAGTDTHPLGADYDTLVHGCGLLDRSERGKLALSGAGAVEFLNGQVTNELATLAPGEGCYAAFLTHKGKMLGDLRVLAAGAPADREGRVAELLLDTERSCLQALFDMIRRFKVGYEVELHKRTVECGMLALIGPEAPAVAAAAGAQLAGLGEREHDHLTVEIEG